MIPRDLENRIVRLHYVEQWRITTIARAVGVHHGTVRRVLLSRGVNLDEVVPRPSIVDPYRDFIDETLKQYPKLPASRLYEMVKERGYPGAPEREVREPHSDPGSPSSRRRECATACWCCPPALALSPSKNSPFNASTS